MTTKEKVERLSFFISLMNPCLRKSELVTFELFQILSLSREKKKKRIISHTPPKNTLMKTDKINTYATLFVEEFNTAISCSFCFAVRC